jgi:3-hydroxyisobutyrate dehydrogenase-like beta-hydroxyacid dehydrogenase
MEIKSVGVIGLGSVGNAIARRLIEQGFDVTVYDRDAEKAIAVATAGARPVRIPADAAESADVVVVRMPDEIAAEEVLFDCGGVGETLPDGGFVVDMSATGAVFARTAAVRLAQLGLISVEAGLVGDAAQVRSGLVRVLTGCTPADLLVITPFLRAFARQIAHVGPVGSVAALRWTASPERSAAWATEVDSPGHVRVSGDAHD